MGDGFWIFVISYWWILGESGDGLFLSLFFCFVWIVFFIINGSVIVGGDGICWVKVVWFGWCDGLLGDILWGDLCLLLFER